MEDIKFFHYRQGKTFLHKTPSWIKIILMVVLAVAAFYVPLIPGLLLWFFLALFSIIILHFSPKETLQDMVPVLFYIFAAYLASMIVGINLVISKNMGFTVESVKLIFIPDQYYLKLMMNMALSLEITSIFYRTTSVTQFNQGFSAIEHAITRQDKTPVADILSLTLTFIPRLTVIWSRLDLTWNARGGKKNTARVKMLVPGLFKSAMEEAYDKALAMENRK